MITLNSEDVKGNSPIPLSRWLPNPRENWQLHQNQKELLTNLQRKCAAKHAVFDPRLSDTAYKDLSKLVESLECSAKPRDPI